MTDHFLSLSCASCGAKLDVYDDMERFACGYCGKEMVVQRRGGTVSLKGVTEAIKKVQIGTDKTAAELALPRLRKELDALHSQRQAIAHQPNPYLEPLGALAIWGALAFVLLILGSLGVVLLTQGKMGGVGIVVVLLLAAFLVAASKLYLSTIVPKERRDRQEWEQKRAAQLTEINSKITETEEEIVLNRETLKTKSV